jgi:transcriptional regulator with XRE-family HTH domain
MFIFLAVGAKQMYEQHIGSKLKSLRHTHNMKQSDLAKALSVSNSTISHWENSRRFPSVIEVKRIADFFQVDVNVLITPLIDDSESSSANKPSSPPKTTLYIPTRIPLLDIYFVVSLCISVLLCLSVFFQPLIGYVTFSSSAIALFVLVIIYAYSQFHQRNRSSRECSCLREDDIMYRHDKHENQLENERLVFMSLAVLSLISLFLFFFAYIFMLLRMDLFILTPFVMTITGMIVITIKILLHKGQLNKHPYVPNILYRDKRIQKGNRLVHSIMTLDTLSIISLIYFYHFHRLSFNELMAPQIVLFGLLTLLLDAICIYRYLNFISAFDLVTKNNDSLFREYHEGSGVS